MLAEARKEYNEKRLEYVGENFSRFADVQRQQIEARREFLEKKKGFAAGAYRVYEKMGQMNLEALGWKPEGKVKKLIAKNVSLKTVVPLVLLGGGLALGAGTAVGASAFLAKRVLAGPMSGMGFYGGMRNLAERKMSRDVKPEKIKEMDMEEAQERLDKVAGYLLLEGKSPEDNRAYQALEAHIIKLAEQEKADLKEADAWEGSKKMKEALEAGDKRLASAGQKAKRHDNVKKGFGALLGGLTGSGALAHAFGSVTHWFGEMFGAAKGGAKVAAQSALESQGPSADVAHPAVETQSSSGGSSHPAETSQPRVERPKHVASRSAGSRVTRTPRAVRAPATTTAAATPPSAVEPPPATRPAYGISRSGTKVAGFHAETPSQPSAPAPEHAPSTEARMRPKGPSAEDLRAASANDSHSGVAETHQPKAVEAPRETLKPLEEHSPDEWRFQNGEVRFHRDSTGAINGVEANFASTGRAVDKVFKDNWIETAMAHDQSPNFALTRSVLEGRARNLLNHKLALEVMRTGGDAKLEQVRFLERSIKLMSKMLTDKYGDIIK
jgi:hypothetical protein